MSLDERVATAQPAIADNLRAVSRTILLSTHGSWRSWCRQRREFAWGAAPIRYGPSLVNAKEPERAPVKRVATNEPRAEMAARGLSRQRQGESVATRSEMLVSVAGLTRPLPGSRAGIIAAQSRGGKRSAGGDPHFEGRMRPSKCEYYGSVAFRTLGRRCGPGARQAVGASRARAKGKRGLSVAQRHPASCERAILDAVLRSASWGWRQRPPHSAAIIRHDRAPGSIGRDQAN